MYDRRFGAAPEIAVEISRQAGKTTTVVDVVAFLMEFYPPISIGIFAPQREQAKTDFDRLKANLNLVTKATGWFNPDEKNANTLRIDNGSECYIFPITPTSHPESKTLDLIIIEEAQSIDDHGFLNDIRPMAAATNGAIVMVGSAAYKVCYFYRLLQKPGAMIIDYQQVIKEKQLAYQLTRDESHLGYEKFVLAERERLGEDADEFKAPYRLEWILGGGQFATAEQLSALNGDYARVYQEKTSKCYAGIDSAKFPDSTVVTIVRVLESKNEDGQVISKQKQLINWLELRGDNYKDQFDIIKDFLSHYNVKGVAIDSTGQGDFMPDMFERETNWRDENSGLYRVKFSAVSKDTIYKNLSVVIQNLLTQLPRLETKEGQRFNQQMLDLQKEYKGELLSAHHPDAADAHDDYPDSWALAEHAYVQSSQVAQPEIRFI